MNRKFLFIRKTRIYQSLKRKFLYCRSYFIYLKFSNRESKKPNPKPVFVFNHVLKCGGTSLLIVLRKWFHVVKDYPPHDLDFPDPIILKKEVKKHVGNKLDIENSKPWELIAGHYHEPEFYIGKRYPGIFENQRVRLISFVREPLDQKLSLYFYGVKRGHAFARGFTVNEFIMSNPNFISNCLGCTFDNYREVLSRYYFIGILEEYDRSIAVLASMVNRLAPVGIPHVNISVRTNKYEKLEPAEILRFKELNKLDYLVYGYCRELFYKQQSVQKTHVSISNNIS